MARRRKRGRRHGGRRNPFGLTKETLTLAGWAIPGGVLARSVPEMLMPAQNSGFTGYALNIFTTVAAAMLADRFIGGQSGKGIAIGGAVATAGRIVEEQFGKKLVEFSSLPGLGNDPGYNLGGYDAASFPLPYSPAGMLPAAPATAGNGASAQFAGF